MVPGLWHEPILKKERSDDHDGEERAARLERDLPIDLPGMTPKGQSPATKSWSIQGGRAHRTVKAPLAAAEGVNQPLVGAGPVSVQDPVAERAATVPPSPGGRRGPISAARSRAHKGMPGARRPPSCNGHLVPSMNSSRPARHPIRAATSKTPSTK